MFRKIFSSVMLVLLVSSMLTLAFNIQPVKPELSPLTLPKESAEMQGSIDLASQEPPPTEWNKTYGGTGYDYAYSVVQIGDGGYALGGITTSFGAGGDDFWLVKTDASGNTQWNKTYGGAGTDWAYSVIKTSEGGYALAGYTDSFGFGGEDFWLVKTDASGNMQWNKTYGGTGYDDAYCVVQTSDGGYAIAGATTSFGGSRDAWLVKTDADGNMQWNKTYGGQFSDEARSIVRTSDGGYALAGYTTSSAGLVKDFWLVKTDANGNMQWNKTYGGPEDDCAYSVVQTSGGGYAIAGATASFGVGNFDAWLVNTDAGGNMQWNKTYGVLYGGCMYSVVQTSGGGFALGGASFDFGAVGGISGLSRPMLAEMLSGTRSTEGQIPRRHLPWSRQVMEDMP